MLMCADSVRRCRLRIDRRLVVSVCDVTDVRPCDMLALCAFVLRRVSGLHATRAASVS